VSLVRSGGKGGFLARVREEKLREVESRSAARPLDALRRLAERRTAGDPVRPFAEALAGGSLHVIAEIKRKSPSAGVIREGASPRELAGEYLAGGASALSVLTDGPHFGGRLEDLGEAREAAPLPALRKDFIVLPYQLYEARAAGADAVLLIAAMLADEELRSLHALAGELGMAALVEVHSGKEMERAARLSPRIIGINSRDLGTMKVDLATFEALAPLAPRGAILVAESGIRSRGDAGRVERAGARAVLVGETLMRAADPAAKIRELLGR